MTFHELEQYALTWVVNTALHIGAPIASAACIMFAAVDQTGIGQLVGVLGPSGVLAWYLYYQEKISKPKKDDQTIKQLSDQQKHYEGVFERQNEFHREQREEDRKQRERDRQTLEKVALAQDRVADCLDRMSRNCEVKE